ncbi:lysozyme [Paraburkholderia sp. Ac-20342]|uniref:lysis system i-spanin subunit Rz n=1 Tax=Paraburkholderia sp. Ac-20342 TaxID=2703889 RepID=UPI00197D6F56|nr:lysis system i-spanin subunit Rz [Paraburkholderia sp. Ac-20342]MBN3848134.1 lysozyme [Paraburkholderia sp. Ac-20342]
MNKYWITGIAAGVLGIALGAGGTYVWESRALLAEQAAHANDNQRHANELNAISKTALDAEQRAERDHTVAEGRIATIDDQLTKEKEAHEADNARNRTLIADGTRRLRIAVSNFRATGGGSAVASTAPGGMGDGASGTADLSPAFGLALFSIADDADAERQKVIYLQGYVCAIRPETDGCATGNSVR